ncbi:TlpA disulfide reductase family protein [Pedobacter sp. PLR]|uniref:TlpA family protein disulfide reductase n=1 Tax=Pedobacter sp. PLR TaxID=2994465 RepID=UPI002246CC02|nr:TlpA disulfide reductase family protein [Pedobacter sp. PLR]MCX2452459.1 TlpA disulfide reductase family protein [Pedobacter sp. PLR]
MKQYIRAFLLVFCCLMFAQKASAQSEMVNITGVLTQKKNAEIAVWSNAAGSKRMIATYVLTPENNRFSFAIPYRAELGYQLIVTILKMGHLRLEKEAVASFPIQLSPKQNLQLRLDPAQFMEKTAKGLLIEKQAPKFSTATVSGALSNWMLGGELSIAKVEEGAFKKVAGYNVEKSDPSFSFLIPVETEGFYYLSTPRWNKRLYLKPNDQIAFNIDGALGLQTVWTKTTAENTLLSDWAQLMLPATGYGYNLEQRHKAVIDPAGFSAAYQALQPKVQQFVQGLNTNNAQFNKLFKTAAQMDNSLLALRSILNLSGKKHLFWLPAKEFSNVPAQYIQILNQNKVNSTDLLALGEGNEYLNLSAKFSLNGLDEAKRQQLGDDGKLETMMAAVPNETLKSFLLKSQLEELNVANYSEFKRVFEPYAKYAKPESVKWKYNHVLEQFAPDTAFIGKSAYDFILPDVNGKAVSMKDFKGKVVLIDVWATWCGPCKAQMPFLKEVEEAYKGNDNIVFVGISVDSESVKQKWLDMIKEKGLDGIQLLDNSGKSFAKKYRIAAIPRFLLIDKKGNWVEVRCPLPEDQLKLKSYIDRELNKGA